MTYWWIGTTGVTPNDVDPSTIQDFRAWHVNTGIFGYHSHRLTIANAIMLGDEETMQNRPTYGITFSDYPQFDIVFDNIEIQNMRTGIGAPIYTKPRNETEPGITIVQNSYLRNYYGIRVSAPGHNNNVVGWSPKGLHVHNTKFEAMDVSPLGRSTPPYPGIFMHPQYGDISHVIISDTVFVYDYNLN